MSAATDCKVGISPAPVGQKKVEFVFENSSCDCYEMRALHPLKRPENSELWRLFQSCKDMKVYFGHVVAVRLFPEDFVQLVSLQNDIDLQTRLVWEHLNGPAIDFHGRSRANIVTSLAQTAIFGKTHADEEDISTLETVLKLGASANLRKYNNFIPGLNHPLEIAVMQYAAGLTQRNGDPGLEERWRNVVHLLMRYNSMGLFTSNQAEDIPLEKLNF